MRSYRPGGALRRRRPPAARGRGARPGGRAADGRQPARQRRAAAARPRLPDFRDYAVDVAAPARTLERGDTRARRLAARRHRAQPGHASASSARTRPRRTGSAPSSRPPIAPGWPRSTAGRRPLSPDGRVMEVLSEHLCQGWLEGYLLTGRHGLFTSYEAFIHIVDSMFNQHAKWLKTTRHIPWRRPIASLNYLLSSHVWRQDHNGFSHQDPGFIDHVVNKKAEIIRVYLPPDANSLLSVADHCLRSRHYVNVIVAGKQPALDYLDMDEAIAHCTRGIGIWDWASTRRRRRTGRRARVRRRRADARDPRRRGAAARAPARAEGPRRQRRRPDAPAGRARASRTASPTRSSTPSSPPTSR